MGGSRESLARPPRRCSAPLIPPIWAETAESIAYDSATWPPPIALVCGPGNSGKSTFSRLLLNTLLRRYKRVGYLDTDVGQPEFATPGCVSLHIVDKHTPQDLTILCLKTPEKCFFFGDVCAKKDPKAHLNYICTLYDYFLINYHQFEEVDDPGKAPVLPLVVNTSGWVKGTGYVTLVEMLRHMSPTHVVQIRVSPESKNLPSGKFWSDGNQNTPVNVIEIHGTGNDASVRSVSTKREARIMRDIRIISYFRQCLPRDFKISTYTELRRCLASIAPIGLHLSSIKIVHLHCQVPSNMIYESLIGSIVGLADSSLFPTSSRCCTPWCLGLGIVRAVDNSEDRIYVITPVSRRVLERVDLVFQGSVEIPTCLLQVEAPTLLGLSKMKQL
ncbi:polynucleotide 5'-hydroxyl-kinase NOL9-like [Ananas comosus]|uniref:Polynucleotide 5'-hydroxyl-kinase NOL9-like n=1 Tax=Ananas comosus TaxID=4615 RepID=A0A6P5FQ58_ANACO|nr:polynucleotide 5'-hydroxyl-kinase NOL9-like [Ananas comosus]